ncbi:hypothetical protein RCL1_008782 [Eukaryota sp. TZLM3-RCL]
MLHPQCIFLNSLPSDVESSYSKSLSQLVPADALKCVLSTFVAEPEWIFDSLPILLQVPLFFFIGDTSILPILKSFPRPNSAPLTVLKPRLPLPYGTHHSKFLISFCPNRLTVAITTANLAEADFLCRNQLSFYQEFAKLSSPNTSPDFKFKDPLKEYLSTIGLDSNWITELDNFDFSTAAGFLVASVPGVFAGDRMSKWGQGRLRSILGTSPRSVLKPRKTVDKDPNPKENVSCLPSIIPKHGTICCSSLGRITKPFLTSMCVTLGFASMSLIWPTVDNVRNSVIGYLSGGSLCANQRNFSDDLKQRLCRWEPVVPSNNLPNAFSLSSDLLVRSMCMHHLKAFVCGSPDNINHVLITSHNFSAAAFGQYSTTQDSLTIRSYELGVLFRSCPELPLKCFESCCFDSPHLFVPLPFHLPAPRYTEKDEFWCWDVPHSEPDIMGRRFTP